MLYVFALVADSVAVIRLGDSDLPDVRRRLSDQLLADTGHRNFRKRRALELDSFRGNDFHGVGKADVEDEFIALHLRFPADALDFQTL